MKMLLSGFVLLFLFVQPVGAHTNRTLEDSLETTIKKRFGNIVRAEFPVGNTTPAVGDLVSLYVYIGKNLPDGFSEGYHFAGKAKVTQVESGTISVQMENEDPLYLSDKTTLATSVVGEKLRLVWSK